ncbi:TPA: fimbrial biogenesis chaperone [Citrobacter freundii]
MLKVKPAMTKMLMAVACLGAVYTAQAAISLDRTRAIFNGAEKSMTLNISNDNKQLPYLAQAWIENNRHEKITVGPIVATPLVQRVEPGTKSMIRLTTTPDINQLPQDRESLFYFNLREIPPKSDKANVLQIALQTKIKLFYRPKAVEAKPNAVWQNQLVLHKTAVGFQIENPTPYYITVIGLGGSETQAKEGEFNAVMIAPRSVQEVKSGNYATPWLTYINDYGGRPTLQFTCKGNHCSAVKK